MFETAELRIHHGGIFRKVPELAYVGGEVGIVRLDPDLISYPHLMKSITEDTYKKVESLSFKSPEDNFKMLKPLWNDASTMELIEMVMKWGTVDVYVEHGIDEPDFIPLLPLTSTTEVQTELQVEKEPPNGVEPQAEMHIDAPHS
ncbi:unnamed protein product, partial [Cuscuta epithymum]